jgi:P27 family predicted phage terminase small subunit
MPGPPPTPTHLKLLRGNPGQRRIRPEPEPAPLPEPPLPPDFLQGYACDEWHRLAPELFALKLLTSWDVQPLAAYCTAYRRWREAEEVLAEMAKSDALTSGLLIKRINGDAAQNPLVKIARHAAADMVRYAGEFGMSPAARARISAGVGYEPPSKFGDLLN